MCSLLLAAPRPCVFQKTFFISPAMYSTHSSMQEAMTTSLSTFGATTRDFKCDTSEKTNQSDCCSCTLLTAMFSHLR